MDDLHPGNFHGRQFHYGAVSQRGKQTESGIRAQNTGSENGSRCSAQATKIRCESSDDVGIAGSTDIQVIECRIQIQVSGEFTVGQVTNNGSYRACVNVHIWCPWRTVQCCDGYQAIGWSSFLSHIGDVEGEGEV